MQPQQFLETLQCAFFESSAQRIVAEQILLKYKDECPNEFMVQCTQAFSDGCIQNNVRVACSILVIRLVGLIHPPSNQLTFLVCSQQTKNYVKFKFMEQLIDPEIIIRRQAAIAIGEICAIELLSISLTGNLLLITLYNTKIRIVGFNFSIGNKLQTYRHLDQGKTHQSTGISDQDSKIILMGICVGMDLNEWILEIRICAINAFQHSLQFMSNLFKQQELFVYVKNLILSNAMCNIQEIKHKSFICLIDFVKQYFSFLPIFIEELYQTTQASFENEGEISLVAIEIWNTICVIMKEELKYNDNRQKPEGIAVDCCVQFFQKNYEGFLLPLMRNLKLDVDNEDDEDDNLSLPDSSYKGLIFYLEFVGVNAYELVSNIIQNNLTHQLWEYKKASIMIFRALSEVQNKQIEIFIKSYLTNLLTCLFDTNYKVKKATAKTLSRVADNYPQCFHEHDQANQILATLLDQLNNKISITYHLIKVFVYLTKELQVLPNSIFSREKLTILYSNLMIKSQEDSLLNCNIQMTHS